LIFALLGRLCRCYIYIYSDSGTTRPFCVSYQGASWFDLDPAAPGVLGDHIGNDLSIYQGALTINSVNINCIHSNVVSVVTGHPFTGPAISSLILHHLLLLDIFHLSDPPMVKMLVLQDLVPSEQYLLATLGVTLCGIILLVLNKRQRGHLLPYLSSWISALPRGRRISSAKTPPRSVSPEKKVPNNGPPLVDFIDIFPPSSREALAKVSENLEPGPKGKLSGGQVSPVAFKKGLIPFSADYRECGSSKYTPMEISMEEVRALGDFPDYAQLSGVPLPKPYKEFQIESALPRPYRPFRWSYHQTMCKSSCLFDC